MVAVRANMLCVFERVENRLSNQTRSRLHIINNVYMRLIMNCLPTASRVHRHTERVCLDAGKPNITIITTLRLQNSPNLQIDPTTHSDFNSDFR